MNDEEFEEVMDALKRIQQVVSMAYWRQQCVEAPKPEKCGFCGEEADHPNCKKAIEEGYKKHGLDD